MSELQRQIVFSVGKLNVNFANENVVTDLDFSVRDGETLAVIGKTGSGKTQSVLSSLGLTSSNAKVESDHILYRDEEVSNLLFPRRISVVFQNAGLSLNPTIKCGQQISRIIRKHLKLSGIESKKNVLALLEQVDIVDGVRVYDSYPHQISGGELQRVMIAMALSCDPDLLILDEPTSSLDKIVQANLILLLTKLKRLKNLTIILISHDLDLVSAIADRIIQIMDGKKIADQSIEDFFAQPQHQQSKVLIKQVRNFRRREFRSQTYNNLLLNLEQVSKVYERGKVAFENVNITIYEGEHLGIIGESGSGKSSLGKCIAGIMDFTTGRMTGKISAEQISYIFQDAYNAMDPELSIQRILEEVIQIHNFKKSVEELLEMVQLGPEIRKRRIDQISGGQRQRVNLARGLAQNPEMIICDEVTSGLDVTIQHGIINLLSYIMKDLTVLFISHDISLIRSFCDRVAIMKDSNVIEIGKTEKIFHHPQHEYSKTLINSTMNVKYLLNT